jgi:hypothetical protein
MACTIAMVLRELGLNSLASRIASVSEWGPGGDRRKGVLPRLIAHSSRSAKHPQPVQPPPSSGSGRAHERPRKSSFPSDLSKRSDACLTSQVRVPSAAYSETPHWAEAAHGYRSPRRLGDPRCGMWLHLPNQVWPCRLGREVLLRPPAGCCADHWPSRLALLRFKLVASQPRWKPLL